MKTRLLTLALLLVGPPAFAQADLSAIWQRFHEDQPERLPGQELGDYTETPRNREFFEISVSVARSLGVFV